jgi:hypothetical protein
MKLSLNVLAPALCCVLLSACAHAGTSPLLPAQAGLLQSSSDRSAASPDRSAETIYVNTGAGVSVFDVTGKLLRTIKVVNAIGIQADSLNHVFISAGENAEGGNELYAYGNRGERLGRAVKHVSGGGTPLVTAADNIWVNCGLTKVCEYDSQPKEIISPHYDESIVTKGIYAVYIAIDRSGDLAVSSGNQNTYVFVFGSTKPYWKLAVTAPYTGAVAFDKAEDLFLSIGNPNGNSGNKIVAYAQKAQQPELTLATPGNGFVTAMQFDRAGNLYALVSGTDPAVGVYPPNKTEPSYTISDGLSGLKNINMAVDQSGRVYVTGCSDSTACTLQMYKPHATSPYATVTQGIGEIPYVAASQ